MLTQAGAQPSWLCVQLKRCLWAWQGHWEQSQPDHTLKQRRTDTRTHQERAAEERPTGGGW